MHPHTKASDPDFARLAMDVFVLRDQFNDHFRARPTAVPLESTVVPMRPVASVAPYLDPDEPGIPYSWIAIRRAVIKRWPNGIEGVPTAVITRHLEDEGALSGLGDHRFTVGRAIRRLPRR